MIVFLYGNSESKIDYNVTIIIPYALPIRKSLDKIRNTLQFDGVRTGASRYEGFTKYGHKSLFKFL